MTGFMDLYADKDTFLHRLDPRVKLLAVATISALAFILTELWSLVLLLAFILLLMALTRSSYRKAFFALKFVVRFMVLITVLWPLFDRSGTPVLLSIGPLDITEPAVWRGATSAVRVGCFATVWYILMFTTSQRDLVRGLVKLGLRFDYGLALAISFRFIPTFGLTIESIKDAQRARALELDKGSFWRRSRNYVTVLVPTVVTALRTAHTLSLTLQSRAYGAVRERTYLREIRMGWSDYLAAAVVLLIFIAPAVAMYYFGAQL
ncbi:MAG: energy-coupling factor transporter transmembrane protein EcfT [Thermoplasmata archaeon]|jgi:energy-coupling factor transport system permease protein|nr:energy-coupling factor transporter transmembrane protein EcfT [Thermoplasmata archaeon]